MKRLRRRQAHRREADRARVAQLPPGELTFRTYRQPFLIKLDLGTLTIEAVDAVPPAVLERIISEVIEEDWHFVTGGSP